MVDSYFLIYSSFIDLSGQLLQYDPPPVLYTTYDLLKLKLPGGSRIIGEIHGSTYFLRCICTTAGTRKNHAIPQRQIMIYSR